MDLCRTPAVDMIWDLTAPLPFPDNSCEAIYSEHVMEHLTVAEGVALLTSCRHVLKPGGVLRIAMPSLNALINEAHDGTWRNQEWLTWPQFRFVKTRAEAVNMGFYCWGHKWRYDKEELYRRLNEGGFNTIRDCEWRQSCVPALCGLEVRKDSKLICEAIK